MKTYEDQQQYAATANEIWQVITNPADKAWRSNISKVEVRPDEYSETSAQTSYATRYTNIQDQVDVSRKMTINHVDGHGTRIFTLRQDDDHLTTLTITEHFESNVGTTVQPLLDQFFIDQQRTYLDDLARKFG